MRCLAVGTHAGPFYNIKVSVQRIYRALMNLKFLSNLFAREKDLAAGSFRAAAPALTGFGRCVKRPCIHIMDVANISTYSPKYPSGSTKQLGTLILTEGRSWNLLCQSFRALFATV